MDSNWIEEFCGEKLWDQTLSWNTETPRFTRCFLNTVLVWVPFVFLLLVSPLEIISIIKSKRKIEWNFYNLIRQFLSFAYIIVCTAECIIILVKHFQNASQSTFWPNITASIIRLVSSFIIFAIFFYHRIRGIKTSGSIWVYFLVCVCCGAPTIHTFIYWYSPEIQEWIIFGSQYIMTVLLFLMCCFADFTSKDDDEYKKSKMFCPKENASYLSRLAFWWFTPMALLGWKKTLTVNDLWQIRDVDKSENIVSAFNKYWFSVPSIKNVFKPKIQSYTNGSAKPNLNLKKGKYHVNFESGKKRIKRAAPGVVRGLISTFWFYFITGACFKLINDLLLFVTPQILKLLIQFISNDDEYDWHGYVYSVLLFFTTMIQIVGLNYYFNRMMVLGMRIRTCLIAAIYRKSLRLCNSARNQMTVGEIVNLMSIDSQRFIELTPFINMLWSAPLQIALSLWFLWQELGISVLGGLAIMIMLIPINGYLTSISKRLQVKQMKLKDERVKAMNEILNGIKVLKLYGWEEAFINNIYTIRNKELNHLRTMNYFGCILQCIWFCTPFLVSFITFALYVLIDSNNKLDAQKAFVSLALFNILRFPLSMLPNLITTLIMTSVSVKRLNKYLNSTELSGYVTRHLDEKQALVMENASFVWESNIDENSSKNNNVILKDICLNVRKGSFVAIVGSVGAGKSSLLSAILGDMEIEEGKVNICSSLKIAFVPQQAWIQNASLKDNILFGNKYNKTRYDQIIHCCALEPDLEILPGGDDTEIGEKGINLSGGQKQRVSLARACFSDADLYLLDDPLSAVDSHVGKHIFDKVLDSKTGILKNKTRILVTNSLSILSYTDQIVVLKDNRISEIGTFNELMAKKGAFAELIDQYSSANKDSKDQNDEHSEVAKIESRTKSPKDKTKLVEVEKTQTGRVKASVYWRYFKAVSIFWCTVILANYALAQMCFAGTSVWLAVWSDGDGETAYYLTIYGVIGFSQCIFVTFGWYAMTRGIIRAAKLLHAQMLDRIMHSPMSFFDTTPLGRILNRFSKDVDTCDATLQMTIRVWIVCFFQTIATLMIISMEVPIFLVVVLPISIIFYFIQKFYVITSRQLKRLESVTRSPIYSHFSETLSGVATIRAYDVRQSFITQSDRLVDENQICYYPNIAANRWLAFLLEIIANVIVLFAAFFSVIYRNDLGPGTVGLIVTYALNATQNLNWLVRTTSDIETNIVGVERIVEYCDLPTEAEWHIDNKAPKSDWPEKGNVQLVNYCTKYRPDLDLVLNKISINIKGGEKIGIVGRTGSGKSSLALALFRLIEPTSGTIIIDDVNVCDIGLHQLRTRLTIIPQDPVLFSGTIRSNLDPFNLHCDDELWDVLDLAHLKSYVKSLDSGLEHKITEGGENLSVGQRQLICLARALLRNTRVLILDEATAAVDLETDSLIQSTIRNAFSKCTVLTIAHRLHTILDSNRVLVLSDGKIAEFDSPKVLMADENSIFYSLARDANINVSVKSANHLPE